jgi:hypothetical protein
MGWIIRFIHNRDKATQNIVLQCSRAAMLGLVPTGVLRSLGTRVAATKSKISERSVLMDAMTVMKTDRQKSHAGMFLLSVQKSRRNTTQNVAARGRLRQAIRKHVKRTGGAAPARSVKIMVDVMTSGIWLNGRQWKTEMFCACATPVARNRPDLASDPSTFMICSIITFHVYKPDDNPVVMARVWKYKSNGVYKGMYIVHNDQPEESEYIALDSIVHGLHPVAHWTDPGLWIGIPWWKAI